MPEAKVKLTDPQYAFLCQLVQAPQTAVENYAPAHKLVDVGFATRVQGRYTWEYTVTEAGRAHHRAIHMADKTCRTCKTAPWTCRECSRKTCEHYCAGKKNDGTAVCGRCRAK
jgi:hypothetical protein